jgi:hypothetical protein
MAAAAALFAADLDFGSAFVTTAAFSTAFFFDTAGAGGRPFLVARAAIAFSSWFISIVEGLGSVLAETRKSERKSETGCFATMWFRLRASTWVD